MTDRFSTFDKAFLEELGISQVTVFSELYLPPVVSVEIAEDVAVDDRDHFGVGI
jgi:hypothetical protein